MAETVYQEPLFIPSGLAVFPQHREVGRIEEQGMERLVADPGAEIAADGHPVKPGLSLLLDGEMV